MIFWGGIKPSKWPLNPLNRCVSPILPVRMAILGEEVPPWCPDTRSLPLQLSQREPPQKSVASAHADVLHTIIYIYIYYVLMIICNISICIIYICMMWYAWYVSVILCAWLRIYIYFYTPMYILRMLILYCIVDTPVKGGKKCGVDPDRQAASRYHRWLCRPKTSIPKSPILTFPKNWVHDWVYHSKPYITQFPDLWSPKLGQSTYTSLDFRRRSMILPCVPNIFGDRSFCSDEFSDTWHLEAVCQCHS